MVTKDTKTVDALLSRGVEQVIVKLSLKKRLLDGEKLVCKLGFDPTGSQLHIGHMVVVRKLRQFQEAGHQIVIIVGDYTARIGDPSGRDVMRKPLSVSEIEKNMRDYKQQIGKILDLKAMRFAYQSEWFDGFNLEKILELTGLFTVQQMLERDMFQKRMKEERPIGLHEFMYPLLQGYDSVAVKADVEFGGTDQTFNLLAGRVVQEHFGQRQQNILTVPLLEGLDGRKMSKSYNNYVAVEDEANEIYGKIMSLQDEPLLRYFELATDVSAEEIREIAAALKGGENPRNVKARLAQEIVKLYHGPKAATDAAAEFDKVFRERGAPSEMPSFRPSKNPCLWVDLLHETKLAPSKSEARRLLTQGGVKLNGKRVKSFDVLYFFSDGDIIQVGKRRFIKIVI